jgi:UDP-N-acetyl-D-glucosamine dehydrogenase
MTSKIEGKHVNKRYTHQKLKDKNAKVAILGLGYVGLPLAVVFGEAGFHVTGVDPDQRKIDALAEGKSYIPDVKTEAVAKLVKDGRFTATTDFSVLKDMDAVSICVPTPLRQTGDPDMSFIISATEELAKYMHKAWWWCWNPRRIRARPVNCSCRNWELSIT